MKKYVIWLDSEIAKIFALNVSGIEKSSLKKGGMDHHLHNKKDNPGDSHLDHFFRDLAAKIHLADELLILGPGRAKSDFRNYLEVHEHTKLFKKIVGFENSDHPTDNQIFATARQFFKTYDLFNEPT